VLAHKKVTKEEGAPCRAPSGFPELLGTAAGEWGGVPSLCPSSLEGEGWGEGARKMYGGVRLVAP